MWEIVTIYNIKDFINLLECSECHAKKVRNDIKEHFGTPLVLLKHFNDYFKLQASSEVWPFG